MYKRKTKLSPIHISLIALAILVVIAVIVTFAVKNDEPKEPAVQSGIVYDDYAIEGGWETLSQEEIEQRLNDKVQAGGRYRQDVLNALPEMPILTEVSDIRQFLCAVKPQSYFEAAA